MPKIYAAKIERAIVLPFQLEISTPHFQSYTQLDKISKKKKNT